MDFADDEHLPEDLYLPEELWTEILARMPVKTLLRFRSVCKTWLVLIDSPDFMSMHLDCYKNNRDKSFLLTQESRVRRYDDSGSYEEEVESIFGLLNNYTFVLYDDNLHISYKYYEPAGDCQGLMLLVPHCVGDPMLWNPSTRNSMVLPPNPWNSPTSHTSHLTFGRYLVGFAPSSNDYKVVEIDNVSDRYKGSVFVYSLKDHRWRWLNNINTANFPVNLISLMHRYVVVYFKGATYWISGVLDQPWTQTHLVYFSFDVEEFGFVELPDAGKQMVARVLFILGDSIAVMSVCSESTCIWVMEKDCDCDDKESWRWRLWFSGGAYLDATELIESMWFSDPFMEVLYDHKSCTLLFGFSDMIYYYDFKNQQLQPIRSLDNLPYCFNYVESLVLHKGSQAQTLIPLP